MEIFKLFGSIFVNTDDADKSMQKTEKGAENIAAKLGNGIKSAAKWGAAMVTASATVLAAVGGTLVNLADSTREYRTEMAKLETAFQSAGLSTEEATGTYKTLQSVLGDTGQAVEAANHLAQLCTTQEELSTWTDICTGVYATFGDSLPIEGLTEAANETAKVGQLTGPLADALNWAGVSEDVFNESLAACTSEQERQALITETLIDIYGEASEIYKQNNADIINANASQESINATMARFGAIAEPIINSVKEKFAEFLEGLVPFAEMLANNLMPLFLSLIDTIMPTIFDLLSALLPVITDIINSVLPIAVELINTLLPPLMQIAQAIMPLVITVLNALTPLLSLLIDLLQPIIQLFVDLLTPIITIISEALQPLIEIISILIESQLRPLIEIVKIVGTVFGTVLKGMLSSAKSVIDNIIGVFKGITTFLKGIFTGDFKMAFQGIVDIVSNIFGGIVNIVKLPINTIIDLINGFIAGLNTIQVPDWVPGLGGKGINIPSIPKLYTGGLVGAGTLISTNEHEPEIIGNYGNKTLVMNNAQIIETMIGAISATMESFIERITAIIGKDASTVGDIIIPIYIGNEKIDEIIVNAKERTVRRSGGRAYA